MTSEKGQKVSCVALRTVREERGMAVAELARQTDVSRQTIYAIEDGSFLPNTMVALKLARALGVSVEALFCLEEQTATSMEAEWLSDQSSAAVGGELARVWRAGKQYVAAPVRAALSYLPAADGIIEKQAGRGVRVGMITSQQRLVERRPITVAGCDPALSLLAEEAQVRGITVIPIPVSSRMALSWLAQGKVDIAGAHLSDRNADSFNLKAIKQAFPAGGVHAFTFAQWESGLVVRAGNPKGIRTIADLATAGVTIVNREKGSGSRAQLDRELKRAGIPGSCVEGYKREARGHLAAAFGVASGWADCCLATRVAARCYGLNFLPLQSERFDLVTSIKFLRSKQGQALADLVSLASLRKKLERVAGYSTVQTGRMVI